jgi:acetyltransferase-like isoleucine patch superfamily enzyme
VLSAIAVRLHHVNRRARIRRLQARIRFVALVAHSTVDVSIDPTVTLEGLPEVFVTAGTHSRLVIGPRAVIGSLVRLELRGGDLLIGPGTEVRRLCRLNAKGRCELGEEVLLSTGVHVHCSEDISLGRWSIVGEYTTIADSNHLRTGEDRAVYHSAQSAPIRIGSNTWIGAKVTIAKGVTIGDQSFVGANSVVTRDVEPWWLVAGIPAVPIKRLDQLEGEADSAAQR